MNVERMRWYCSMSAIANWVEAVAAIAVVISVVQWIFK